MMTIDNAPNATCNYKALSTYKRRADKSVQDVHCRDHHRTVISLLLLVLLDESLVQIFVYRTVQNNIAVCLPQKRK